MALTLNQRLVSPTFSLLLQLISHASGAITGATGVTLTSGDITTPGNISATGTGTITSAGLLTSNGGLTVTGTTNINTSGSSAVNIGTGTYSGNLTLGNAAANIAITDANWNISDAGAANFFSIGATTPGSGAFHFTYVIG